MLPLPYYKKLLLFFLCVMATVGCKKPPCVMENMAAITSTQQLEQTCEFPESWQETWACETPAPESKNISTLSDFHSRCKLDALGTQREFAFSDGDHVKAANVLYWLEQHIVLFVLY